MDKTAWTLIDELLAYHQKPGRDFTPTDALNRLFARYVRRERLRLMPRLDRDTCSVALESWGLPEMQRLALWHGRARPRFEGRPIVVARCGDRYFVLDGNNRTNKCLAERDPARRHEVIVVRPRVLAVPVRTGWPSSWAEFATAARRLARIYT